MPTGEVDAVTSPARETEDEKAVAQEEVSLVDLLLVIAKRRRMIIRTVVCVAILSAIVSLLIPNRYTATTTLLPPQQPQSLASTLAAQLGGSGVLGAVAGSNLGLKNPNDIYVGMLKSRVISDALIQKFDLMHVYRDKRLSDARKDLAEATDIQLGKDGFITVSFEDKDRKRAANVANAYVDQLRGLTSTLAVTEAGQRRLFFEQQLQKAKDDLAGAENALKNTQQSTGIIALDSQAKAIIESVAAIRAQIAAKEVQLQGMQAFATNNNPDVVVLRQELSGLQGQLARLEKQGNAGNGDIQVPTAQVPQAGLEYARRLRDVKYYETVFELLAKQFEVAKLDEAREGAIVQVVDPAVEPDKKSSPKRALIVLMSILVALGGAMLWALFAESLENIKDDPERAEQWKQLKRFFAGIRR